VTGRQQRDRRLVCLGQAIKEQRLALGLTQEQLAHLIGSEQVDVSRLESGRNAIRIDRFWVLAESLAISPAELLMVAERIEASATSEA